MRNLNGLLILMLFLFTFYFILKMATMQNEFNRLVIQSVHNQNAINNYFSDRFRSLEAR